MSRLEILLRAYVEVTALWAKGQPGEMMSRLWKSARFLERLIKEELRREMDSK